MNILSDADPAELNYMLPKIGLGLLFYKVKDHVPLNLHRTRLLDLLAVIRISVSSMLEGGDGGRRGQWEGGGGRGGALTTVRASAVKVY